MEFSKEELKWIENHKDMINNQQFFDLFLAANTFQHGNIFDRMQFAGKLNYVLYIQLDLMHSLKVKFQKDGFGHVKI